ncbi:MAG: hypothetical protein II704_05855 [Erysipelotrichaceae bacterium]|nr:hypothetical protein [Erysipelotrichaceae bacterium]
MKHVTKLISLYLVFMMMLTGIVTVRAEEEEPAEPVETMVFQPGPIMNEPLDYSDGLVVDEDTQIRPSGLLNSILREKMEQEIDELLNFKSREQDSINSLIYAIDDFLWSGGYSVKYDTVGSLLQGSGELAAKAGKLGLQETRKDLIEVIDTGSNATGYIFVIDRSSVGIRVANSKDEGIAGALVTISYTDGNGNTVTRSEYTTGDELPGLCAFDNMTEVSYIMIDVQAEHYRAQTILDKKITAGDILHFQLEDSPENDVYLRCVDMGGKDMLTEDTNMFLVEKGSKPLEMRVIVTATGNRTLPDKITMKEYNTQRSLSIFNRHSEVSPGGALSRMFNLSQDWMKKGGPLKEDDVLCFDVGGNEIYLKRVRVRNALLQPGTSDEQLPLTGTDKEVPLKDVMGGTGVIGLTCKYLKVPVTVGYFPEGGFIIVATFDIESLSTSYSSLFEESWNPKTRAEGESIIEPFKQEFWRKADRFKSGTGQMDDSKRCTWVRDKYWSFNVSFSLFCTGKYNETTGNFDGSFGGCFDAKLSGGVTQYFLVSTPIVIPFYVGVNIYGDFKSSMSLNFVWSKLSDGISAAFSAADHAVVERFELVAGLDFYVGVGLKGACSLEVAGGAAMDFADVVGTVEGKDGKDGSYFLIDSFASVRVTGSIAFFTINLFSKTFGPWRLYPDTPKVVEPPEPDEAEFLEIDLSAANEKGTLLLAGTGDQLNHYKSDLLTAESTTINGFQTITPLANDTYGDSQVQIVSTKKTTALFRIAVIDGRSRVVYQKQDPVTGKFNDDYYELPAFRGYDVTEFDVAASSGDDNLFYVGMVVADGTVSDMEARSLTTWVAGTIVDLDKDSVRTQKVRSPLPDGGKYFYFNPRVAGRGDDIAVAYQRTHYYKSLDLAEACLFGTNEKQVIMGRGNIYTSGDIVDGEPSFFVTNRDHTTSDRVVIDGYNADGSFDENNPRQRYAVNVKDYVLQERETFVTNWGYVNQTNFAIIAGKLYFLEKYADSYDSYGYGMRLTEVENSEGLINRENIYEFVVNDDKNALCLVSATTSYDMNMETGASKVKGSTLKIYTLEAIYDSSNKTNRVILHGPLDVFVKNAEMSAFAAVFNRANCEAKGLSVVYATGPKNTLTDEGKVASTGNLYQWQQNLIRGMVATAVDFADLFYFTDEFVIPITITFQNIGYAIESKVGFTIQDEHLYDMHEMYKAPNGQWYDMGNGLPHDCGRLFTGDTYQMELLVAAPYFWESGRVHEVNVEIHKDYRGDAEIPFRVKVYDNKLTLQGEQIVLGDTHYADLSVTNIGQGKMNMNKVAVETRYLDEDKEAKTSYIDLSRVETVADLDKYTFRYDLQPIWDRAEEDGVLLVRFFLVDENNQPLTGESVFMTPYETLSIEDVSYEVVEGKEGTWYKDSEKDYDIRVKRSVFDENCFAHFTSVSIDGRELIPDEDYTAESGSTLIHLKKEMLQQLSEEEHEVLISFDDGEATATLKVELIVTPPTGDESPLMAWSAALLLSLIAIAWVYKEKKFTD